MTREHFERMKRQPVYKPAVAFILALRSEGVPLSAFTTNDGNACPAVAVYIETPYPFRLSKRYERLDRLTIRYAAKWWKDAQTRRAVAAQLRDEE